MWDWASDEHNVKVQILWDTTYCQGNSDWWFNWDYQSFGNFSDIKRISQTFSGDDAVGIRCGYFDLKIPALIMNSAFCGLHNDKYTKFSPHKIV